MFKKNNDENKLAKTNNDIDSLAIDDAEELVAEIVDEQLALSLSEGSHSFEANLGALVPLIVDVAAAKPGKNIAVVKFPVVDGKQLGFNDLLNRKTPGWENWKQLGGFGKDGKFNPQAAIKEAGLKSNPAAVANLALQGAAIVVGQAYMTEINNKLETIESEIAAISQMLEQTQKSQIEGNIRAVKRFVENLEENLEDDHKRQAAIGSLENIRTETFQLWSFQILALNNLKKELSKQGRIDVKKVEKSISDLHKLEEASAATFQLLMMIEQASMQYDNNFSEKRINKAKEEAVNLLEEYQEAHEVACRKLGVKVDKVKGVSPIALAKRRKLKKKPVNPVHGLALNAGEFAGRITPLALFKEGKRQKSLKKNELWRDASSGDRMADAAEGQIGHFNQLDFMFNKANGLLISEGEIRFIINNESDD